MGQARRLGGLPWVGGKAQREDSQREKRRPEGDQGGRSGKGRLRKEQ